jgi:hypothetical protein
MGFFGTYVYDRDGWKPHRPGQVPELPAPWLTVDIYDSDFATVGYSPAGRGSGVAYLGFTPRDYFEDPEAAPPTDVEREAAGLADWWAQCRGGATTDSDRAAKERELAGYLADDDGAVDLCDETIGQFDDEDIFVEIKTARFLGALDLPAPDDLPG